MILLIDIGNTCLKWAIVRNQIMEEQQSVVHQGKALFSLFQQIWAEIVGIQVVWVANVAGEFARTSLIQWVEQYWQITPLFANTTAYACGVSNGYQYPEQLGIDRWLALIGAHQAENICIADCGTAITVDILSANGSHLGGMIVPGIAAMQKALLADTAALASLVNAIDYPIVLEAKNTTQGILSGVHYAVIGFLTYLLAELEKKYHQTFILVITGGNAPKLLPFLPKTYQHIPDLVLRGLKVIADKHS